MDPRVKIFFIVNGVILSVLVVYMLFVRPKIKKTGFKIKGKSPPKDEIQNVDIDSPTGSSGETVSIEVEGEALANSRAVNVIFTWNGHAWDAFEVLGIPAGSSMVEVTKAYDEALKKVDTQSQEFIRKAYRSICEKLGKAS